MALTLEQGTALEAIKDFLADPRKAGFSSLADMPERGRRIASSILSG